MSATAVEQNYDFNMEESDTKDIELLEKIYWIPPVCSYAALKREIPSFDSDNLTCLISGGNVGSDYEFLVQALKHNHCAMVMSFKNHLRHLPANSSGVCKIIEIDPHHLDLASEDCESAKVKLNQENLQTNDSNLYEQALIQSGYYQINQVTSVYVVGTQITSGEYMNSVSIEGKCGRKCQMFADLFMKNKGWGRQKVPLYLFDQNTKNWKQLVVVNNKFHNWEILRQVPKPTKFYAGIGSTKLSDTDKKAIASLYI